MEENKNKLVFSSVKSENEKQQTPPKEAVDKAFHDEYIRQTQEIPVEQIRKAYEQKTEQTPVKPQNIGPQQIITPPNGVVQTVQKQPTQVVQRQAPQQQPTPVVKQEVLKQVAPVVTKEEPKQQVAVEQPKSEPQTTTQEKPKQEEQKVVKEKHRMKKSAKITMILAVILVAATITIVQTISYFNNPKGITTRALKLVSKEIKEAINLTEQATPIGDNYNISSKMTTNLDSQIFKEESATDPEMLEKLYLINNLNNSKTTFSIIHDTVNKKFFYNSQTVMNDKVIVNDKYLIDNSTEYYFVKDFVENYINDGNNTYFETINEDKNAIDNFEYIYKIVLENLASCIDDEYYNVTNTTTYLDNKTENVKKVSLKLDNVKLRKIANNLLKVLKKDNRAFNILNGVIDDFANYRITSKTKYLATNETLNIIFYTKGTLNKIKKYEVSITGSKESKSFTYEVDNKKITLLKDNKVKYYLIYKISSTNIKIEIQNKLEKKVGSISFDNTDAIKHFTFEFEDDNYNASIDINYKMTDKKKTSYNSKTKCIINIKKEEKNYLSGTITIDSKTTNKTKFEEEIKEVTFSSEITEEKHDELKNLLKTRLKKAIS